MRQLLFRILWHFVGRRKRSDLLRKQGAKIGEKCEIYRGANFGSEPYLVTLGAHVRITNGVKFCTHDGGMWVLRALKNDMQDADKFGTICVGNNVHIGWDTIIMPGVTIGDNCVIGCGSIVTKDIPSNTISCGIPAKPIKTIEEYYQHNRESVMRTAGMDNERKKKLLTERRKAHGYSIFD